MGDFLTEYIHRTALANTTNDDDLLNAQKVLSRLVNYHSPDLNPVLLFPVAQVAGLDPDAATLNNPRISALVDLLRADQRMAARGDTAPRWARAISLALLDALQSHWSEVDDLIIAMAMALRQAAVPWGDESAVAGLIDRAQRATEDASIEPPTKLNDVLPRLNLLWWAQAGWSGSLWLPYEAVPLEHRGVWMTEDFAQLAPPGLAAESFLVRSLRQAGIPLTESASLRELAEATRRSWIWGKEKSDREFSVVPHSLEQVIKAESTGMPALGVRLGVAPRFPDSTCTLAEWLKQHLRETIMVRRIVDPEAV